MEKLTFVLNVSALVKRAFLLLDRHDKHFHFHFTDDKQQQQCPVCCKTSYSSMQWLGRHLCYLLWLAILFFCCVSWKLSLKLRSPLCAGLRCVYFPASGDEWLNQKWHSDGTELIILIFLCHDFSFTCQLFVFSSLLFFPPARNLSCLFGSCLFGFEHI